MQRYFFDFVREAQILHDHQGIYCAGPDVARDVGVPHRGYYHRRHRHWSNGQWMY